MATNDYSMEDKMNEIFGNTTTQSDDKKKDKGPKSSHDDHHENDQSEPKQDTNKKATKKTKSRKATSQPAQSKVRLKEVQRFLTDSNSDGVEFFNSNSMEYLNGDMTIKKYPDLLKNIPYLPDLAPIVQKYVASKNNDPNSFNMQMKMMINRGSATNRHDFSLMVPEYIQQSLHRIAKIANSKNAKNFPSLVKFKEDFGERYITNSTLLFALLNGKFVPDHDLKLQGFQYLLSQSKKDTRHVLEPLILNHTITPRNYRFVGKDTTTFNFPSNFAEVIALATIDNLKSSEMLSKERLEDSINDDSLVLPNSKSFGNSTIYQKLQQMLNLRMLVNTKIQHVLFDGLNKDEL